jgi:hypothetical protein
MQFFALYSSHQDLQKTICRYLKFRQVEQNGDSIKYKWNKLIIS